MGRTKTLIFIFLAALILRLSLVFVAYHGDLNNNISWGTLAVERGLSGFYGSPDANDWPYSAPNQPPLTILLLAGFRVVWIGIENISWWFNNNFPLFPSQFIWFWESKGMILLMKLPSTVADLGIAAMIYHYIVQKKKDYTLALILSFVWLFNPITWYNSAIWGQTDSVVNLLGLIGIWALLNKNLIKFAIFFTLSLLFKGSLTIFIPILIFIAYKQRYPFNRWLHATFYMLLATFLISIWFHPQIDLPFWLINLYKERILPGEIGYLTANAFNFWWLVDSGKTLDSTVYFGLQARLWGFVAVLTGIILVMIWLKHKINDKRIFASLLIVSFLSFLFLTRIHERYLYPFFPPATILLGFIPYLWIPYAVVSLTHLLNLYHLFWAPSLKPLELSFMNPALPQILSLVNILTFVYLLRHFRSSKL
mgnify:CR=1 FL=1